MRKFAFVILISSFWFGVSALASAVDDASNAADNVAQAAPVKIAPLPPTVSQDMDFVSKVNLARGDIGLCGEAATTAGTYCLAESSPAIHQGMVIVGGLVGVMQASKSVAQSCEKQNQALAAAKVAMTAYSTACATVQVMCHKACTKSLSSLKVVREYTPTSPVTDPTTLATIKTTTDAAAISLASVETAEENCKKYMLSLGTAAVGIMNLVKEMQSNTSCIDQTKTANCQANPNDPKCSKPDTSKDCTLAENGNTPFCICKQSPTLAGCPGAGGINPGLGAMGGDKANRSGMTAPSGTTFHSGGDPSASVIDGSRTGSGGGSSAFGAMGAGSGGGGAGGISGGGSGAGAQAKGTDGKTGLNANILRGNDSGGGGGGGGSSGGTRSASPYDAYLPGGAKDPNRTPAAMAALKAQVTKAGSKSNWEKVTERYQENKPSLMQGR